jgi:DNA-directed RNA polymerase specialized sigma24 family protein
VLRALALVVCHDGRLLRLGLAAEPGWADAGASGQSGSLARQICGLSSDVLTVLPAFRPLTELELAALSDDDVIAYLRAARAAGQNEAARLALRVLVFGYWNIVASRVSMKLPAHAVEDVTGDVIADAIRSSFAGESVGEFRSWLQTILKRRVADFYRAREREPETTPLERDAAAEPAVTDQSGYVEVQVILQALLDEMRDDHRRVVEIMVFEDRSADDACAAVPDMTPANAYQVVRRFRTELRRRLEDDDNG